MRRILLVGGLLVIAGFLVIGGCASIPQETYERLKFWKNHGESYVTPSPPSVQDEKGTIDTLNSFVRGSEVELPRGAR
jgi:hypothetical protein